MHRESLHLREGRERRIAIFAIFALLTLVGVVRIVEGYTVFSVTYDEREQVASGMEWLADGTYTYDVVHPPLSRLFAAIGPFLEGNVPRVQQVTLTRNHDRSGTLFSLAATTRFTRSR